MKIAIITGASSGIGQEFVLQVSKCIRSLDEIWVIARRTERLKELKATCPVTIRIFGGDLQKTEVYENLEQALLSKNPNIRMLVNAAGFGKVGTFQKLDSDIQTDMIDINCKSLTALTHLCLPYCEKGSRIINIASAAAFLPQPQFAVYAATKSYVLSFSDALGRETKKQGIVVTAVCPGPVTTEFFEISGTWNNPIKGRVDADAKDVVKKALWDSKEEKTISVYGVPMKAARIATRLLPKGLLLRLMDCCNK